MGTSGNVLGNAVAVALEGKKLGPLPRLGPMNSAPDPLCRAGRVAANVALIGDALDCYLCHRVYRQMHTLSPQRVLSPVSSACLLSFSFTPPADTTILQRMAEGCNSRHVSTAIVGRLGHSVLKVHPPLTADEIVDQGSLLKEGTDLYKRDLGIHAVFGSEKGLFQWADINLSPVLRVVQSVYGCPPSEASASTRSSSTAAAATLSSISTSTSFSSSLPSSSYPSLPSSVFEFSSTASSSSSPSPHYHVASTTLARYPIGPLALGSSDSESEDEEGSAVEPVPAVDEVEGMSDEEDNSEPDWEDAPRYWGSSSGGASTSSSMEEFFGHAQASNEGRTFTSTSSSSISEPASLSASTSLSEGGLGKEPVASSSRELHLVGVRDSASQSSSVASVLEGIDQGATSEVDINSVVQVTTATPQPSSLSLATVSAPSNSPTTPPTSHPPIGIQSLWRTRLAEQVEARAGAARKAAASSTSTLVPSTSTGVVPLVSGSPSRLATPSTSEAPLPSAVPSSGDSSNSSGDSANTFPDRTPPSSSASRKGRLASSSGRSPSPSRSAHPSSPSSSPGLLDNDLSSSGSPIAHQSKKRKVPVLNSEERPTKLIWYVHRLVVHDARSVPMPAIASGKDDIASKNWEDHVSDWRGMAAPWECLADAPLGELRWLFVVL